MANRKVPDASAAKDARFNQLTVERFRTDARAAGEHSASRNDRVARVLCFLGMLRRSGRIRQTAVVECIAAQRQHFSSPSGYQAAHYLPGQIRVDGSFPWLLIADMGTRRQLENLFAEVEHLRADYNKADSAAEACGLKDTFGRSCEAVIRRATPQPGGGLDRRAVREAYLQTWCAGAKRAFQAAIQQKDGRPHLPPLAQDDQGNILNLDARSAPEAAAWAIEEQLAILRGYLNGLHVPPPALSDPKLSAFETAFKV